SRPLRHVSLVPHGDSRSADEITGSGVAADYRNYPTISGGDKAPAPGRRLQCFQIFDKVSFLLVPEAELEQWIVMVDHSEQIGGAAIVEVWRMLPERAQRRRAVHFRGAARCIYRFRTHLERRVQERDAGIGAAEHIGEQRRLVAPCASGGTVEQILTASRCRLIEAFFRRRGRQ